MQGFTGFVLVALLMILGSDSAAQPICVAPELSEQQIRSMIEKERATRTDLPAPFPEYKSVLRRQGCHYVYIEFAVPEGPERNNFFTLNQYGVIVDTRPTTLKCPERTLTEGELADIVRNARAKRRDLPPPFPASRTRVDRLRCLYLYSETAVPETRGNYQAFTIDPLGEVMDVIRPQPR